jgi:hypothetical protein
MSGLVTRTYQHTTRVAKRWLAEAPARRFMSFCRAKWPHRGSDQRDSVVLVGLFNSYPLAFCYAYVINHLAEKFGSRIESYQLHGEVNRFISKLYESFGARFGLGIDAAAPYESLSRQQADEIFAGLKTKEDVVEIAIEGLVIGDQIYNSYLRFFNEPTVHLDDPRLRELIFQSFQIYYAARDYLARNRVTTFFTDDFSYVNSGIITRLLFLKKVPIYQVVFGQPFFLRRVDPEPPGEGYRYPVPVFHSYYRFPEMFRVLPAKVQEAGIERARESLEKRLAGVFCPHVNMSSTTFGDSSGRILDDGPEPRILVMLHDFVDSPHCYRDLLFPDFIEWINFLLERAEQTPFRWYVKPHPCSGEASRAAMNAANEKAVAKLKGRFKKVTFLPPGSSNKQIIQDGVNAMFTVYGTAAHEYAYQNVPVVCCGDNPHIAYDFNIHARTREEYADVIRRADQLQVKIDKRKIEEFLYMNYFYLREKDGSPTNPIDERIFSEPDAELRINQLNAFDRFLASVTPERETGVAAHLDLYFSNPA